MLRRSHCLFLLSSSAVLTGCATLASSYPTAAIPARPPYGGVSGVSYSLPKAMVRAGLVRDAGGIAVIVDQLTFVPDQAASYVLAYRPSGTSNDKLKITVEDDLLTGISGEADDQTAAIVEAVGKLLFLPESAIDKSGAEVLVAYTFDAADASAWKRVEGYMNTALSKLGPILTRDCDVAVQTALAIDIPGDAAGQARKVQQLTAQTRAKTGVCRAAASYNAPALSLDFAYAPFKFAENYPVAACSVGVCARRLQPATLAFNANGIPFASDKFLLPNGSDPVPYALARTTFAKTTHEMVFKNGMVTSAEVNKGSELLAIVNIPLNIIKGIFTTAAELVQLRINLTNKDKELLEARQARRKAEDDLEDFEDLLEEENKAEAALSEETALLFAYVPGLGPDSGAGRMLPASLPNETQQQRPAANQQPQQGGKQPAGGPAQQATNADGTTGVDAGNPLGTQVQGGNDGSRPR